MSTFENINDYPFLKTFIENINVINSEFENAQKLNPDFAAFCNSKQPEIKSHFYHWLKEHNLVEEDYRNEDVGAFPIYKDNFPFKWYSPNELFPVISKLIKQVPNLNFCAIFKNGINSGSKLHTHKKSGLIFHLLLTNHEPNTCYLEVNEHKKYFEKRGDYLIFDYSKPHLTQNNSSTTRFTFVIDFNPPHA